MESLFIYFECMKRRAKCTSVKCEVKYSDGAKGGKAMLKKYGGINPLNAELNPICHLLALLGGATIVVVSRLRVNWRMWKYEENGDLE